MVIEKVMMRLIFWILVLCLISACSSVSDLGITQSRLENRSFNGYYWGHYGRSGWQRSIQQERVVTTPVFKQIP